MWIPVRDKGTAVATVLHMNARADVALHEMDGHLQLAVSNFETDGWELDVQLAGGASWLYSMFLHLFTDRITSAINGGIADGVQSAVASLDGVLRQLSTVIPVQGDIGLRVDLVGDPLLARDTLTVGTRGEFFQKGHDVDPPGPPPPQIPPAPPCQGAGKMVTVAVTDAVLHSAAAVFQAAGSLAMRVTRLPDKVPLTLNTKSWRWVVPGLWAAYPDAPMVVDVAALEPPVIQVVAVGIEMTALVQLDVQVLLDNGTAVSAFAVAANVSLDGAAGIREYNVTARVRLVSLALSLKWTNVGPVNVALVQRPVTLMLRDVLLPLVNGRLAYGFPLPVTPIVDIRSPEMHYSDRFLYICADVAYIGGFAPVSECLLGGGLNQPMEVQPSMREDGSAGDLGDYLGMPLASAGVTNPGGSSAAAQQGSLILERVRGCTLHRSSVDVGAVGMDSATREEDTQVFDDTCG
eukprot:jgi/Mesvir1/10696/Mv13785-RA.1